MGCKVASTRQWIHSRYHTIEWIDSLAGLTNVYFDTGAICEAGAIHACIKAFGSKRVMYGSDVSKGTRAPSAQHYGSSDSCLYDCGWMQWPVSEVRGTCISMGDRFQWIYPNTAELDPSGADPLNDTESSVALIGFETLRAVKLACEMAGCSRQEVEDIMCECNCLAVSQQRLQLGCEYLNQLRLTTILAVQS
jgi:hypothetical protein